MKDRCPKSVGDAKQTLEIRVSQKEAAKDTDGNKSIPRCTTINVLILHLL